MQSSPLVNWSDYDAFCKVVYVQVLVKVTSRALRISALILDDAFSLRALIGIRY